MLYIHCKSVHRTIYKAQSVETAYRLHSKLKPRNNHVPILYFLLTVVQEICVFLSVVDQIANRKALKTALCSRSLQHGGHRFCYGVNACLKPLLLCISLLGIYCRVPIAVVDSQH